MNWTEGRLARHAKRKDWNRTGARHKGSFVKAKKRPSAPRGKSSTSAERQHYSTFVPLHIRQIQEGKSLSSAMLGPQAPTWPATLTSPQDVFDLPQHSRRYPKNENHVGRDPDKQDCVVSKPNLETQRKRLLQEADWTGLNFQKSIIDSLAFNLTQTQQFNEHRHSRHKPATRPSYPLASRRQHQQREYGASEEQPPSLHLQIGSVRGHWSTGSNTIRNADTPVPSMMDLNSSQQGEASSSNLSRCTESQASSCYMPSSDKSSFVPQLESTYSCGQYTNASDLDPSISPFYYIEEYQDCGLIVHANARLRHPRPTRRPKVLDLDAQGCLLETASSISAQPGTVASDQGTTDSQDVLWDRFLDPNQSQAHRDPAGPPPSTKEASVLQHHPLQDTESQARDLRKQALTDPTNTSSVDTSVADTFTSAVPAADDTTDASFASYIVSSVEQSHVDADAGKPRTTRNVSSPSIREDLVRMQSLLTLSPRRGLKVPKSLKDKDDNCIATTDAEPNEDEI